MTFTRNATPPRLLAVLYALLPAAALAVEPAVHAEAGLGVDTNPRREAGGEQGAYPFTGAILDVGLAYGGDRTTLRAAFSEGARLYTARAEAADVLATRVLLDGGWAANDALDLGALLSLRDISELGGVRSETGGQVRLDARLGLGRFDLEASGGASALYPRTTRLEDFAQVGPDVSAGIGFTPRDRQRLRLAWELRLRTYPRWPTARDDQANGLVVEWTRHGSAIAGAGYEFTANTSSVAGGSYRRHRIWVRGAAELPWEVTLAATASLRFSTYPSGLIADAERLLNENDERENALELRFSRPIGRGLEAVLKLAAYGGELSSGDAGARLPYRREVVQLSIGWRPE